MVPEVAASAAPLAKSLLAGSFEAAATAESSGAAATHNIDVRHAAAEASKAVVSLSAFGDHLAEALGGADLQTCSEVQHKVGLLISSADASVQQAKAAWKLLQIAAADREVASKSNYRSACAASLAADALLQDAALFYGPSHEVGSSTSTASPVLAASPPARETELGLLQQTVDRVAAITGHAVVLVRPTDSTSGSAGDSGHDSRGGKDAITPPAVDAHHASQVHVTMARTAVTRIALSGGGPAPMVRVAFFSIDEASSCTADGWNSSTHAVFQRVSAWAMKVMAQCQAQRALQAAAFCNNPSLTPDDRSLLASACTVAAVEDFLLWVTTHDDLFTRPCQATGVLLAVDAGGGHFFPPLLRSMGPQHDGLRMYLVSTARGGKRIVYHPHAMPRNLLFAP